jgi:Rieske Fe-S protein
MATVVGKWFSSSKIREIAELAPGEARIVKYEGDSFALYKDENGGLHAVNPACTHIKCKVAWNNAERTWDCPCHGSRFDADGIVYTAPARKDLEKIELKKVVE